MKKALEAVEQKRDEFYNDAESLMSGLNQTVKLLEAYAGAEREILKDLGMDNHLTVLEDKKSEMIIRDGAEEEHNQKLYRMEEIAAVCQMYNLKFLSSRNYTGSVPGDLASIIRRIAEKDGLGKGQIQSDFFIMAPPEAFTLTDLKKKPVETFDRDPVMFQKVSYNRETFYKPIKEWGNDFTNFRKVLGFINRSHKHVMMTVFLPLYLMIPVLFTVLGLKGNVGVGDNIALGVCGLVIAIIMLGATSSSISRFDGEPFNKEGFNKSSKYYINI